MNITACSTPMLKRNVFLWSGYMVFRFVRHLPCAIMYNISEKRHQIFNSGKYLFTITSCECNICEKSFIQSRKQSVRKGEEILRLFLIHL